MFDILKNWITSIVVIIMFMALVDIVLPSNSLKKYAKLVMGLIVIIIIISPIFNLFSRKTSIEGVINQYMDKFSSVETAKSDKLISNFDSETIKAFKDNLKKKIEESIYEDLNKKYKITELEVVEDKNSQDYLKVKTIVLSEEKQRGKVEVISKIYIGKNDKNDNYIWDNKTAEVLENKYDIKESAIKFVK